MAEISPTATLRQELDDITMEFFYTLDSLYETYTLLESAMGEGYMAMSRARYCMGGTRNVGSLQFQNNGMAMEPLLRVNIVNSQRVNCEKIGDTETADICLEYCLIQNNCISFNNLNPGCSMNTSTLRNRKREGANLQMTEANMNDVNEMNPAKRTMDSVLNVCEENAPKLKNPLTLFGVLVSPHLRHCQSSFKYAIALSVKIASLKHMLQRLQKNYDNLLKKKAIC